MVHEVQEEGLTRRRLLTATCALPVAAMATDTLAQSDRPLLTRAIPHSNEQLPVVGLGTAVSFPSGDQQQEGALKDVVDALVAGGGKLIDTASTYGDAEAVIGSIVELTRTRERLFLAT